MLRKQTAHELNVTGGKSSADDAKFPRGLIRTLGAGKLAKVV